MLSKWKRRPWSPTLLSVAAFAPFFVVAFIATFNHDWALQGDMALEVMRARDVGQATPLIGAFSRYGWSHPGPILFYLLALPSKFDSNPSLWVTLAGLMLKWVPLAGSFAILRKAWGAFPAITFAAMAYLFLLNHRDTIWTIWNPTLGLSLFLFLLVVIFTAHHNNLTPVWTLVAGSILVQLHVGFIPVIMTTSTVLILVSIWLTATNQAIWSRSTWIVSILLSLILWTPPLLDQFFKTGNLGSVIEHFFTDRDPNAENVGFDRALRIVSFQLQPYAPWNGNGDIARLDEAASANLGWLIVLILIIAMLALISFWRSTFMAWPLVLSLTLIVVAIVSVSEVSRPAYPYLFAWVTVVSLMSWMTVLIAIAALLPQNVLAIATRIGSISLALIVALTTFSLAHAKPIAQFEMHAVRYFSDDLESVTFGLDRVGVIHTEGFAGIGFGIMLELERLGVDVFVENIFEEEATKRERMWGTGRSTGTPPSVTLAVTRGGRTYDFLTSGFGWEVESIFAPHAPDYSELTAQTPENVVVLLSRVRPN